MNCEFVSCFRRAFVLAFAAASLSATTFLAAQSYIITPLAPLPGDTYSGGEAINSAGQVGGYSGNNSGMRGAIWIGGVPSTTHTLTTQFESSVRDLNDSLQAVGQTRPGVPSTSAFLWEHGTMQMLVPPSGTASTIAEAITSSGVIVGSGGVTGGHFGYRLDNGVYSFFDSLPGQNLAGVYAVNNA